MSILKKDLELIALLKSEFPENAELIEHLDEMQKAKNYYELIPGGFFWYFPSDGSGLEKIFLKLEKGDQILPRLLEIFSISEGSDYHYFLPNGKIKLQENEIQKLAEEYLKNLLAIIDFVADEYSTDFLEALKSNPPQIRIVNRPAPKLGPNEDDEFVGSVYEMEHEFVNMLDEKPSLANRFHEALYQMCCSYDVVHYVLWPLYEESSPIKDPFNIHIRLWSANIDLSFDYKANCLLVHNPSSN